MKVKSILVVLFILLLMASPVLASDYSSAQYLTTIQIANSTNATISNGVAALTLSTAGMITGKMLNATATDATLITGTGGSDIIFMPGNNATSPWCAWVNSATASSSIFEYLYSKGATGGLIYYFPDTNGMAVLDNATLEFGSNFDFSISFYLDIVNYPASVIYSKGGSEYISTSAADQIAVYFNTPAGPKSFTTSGIIPGFCTLRLYTTSGNMTLTQNGVYKGSVSLGGSNVYDLSTNIQIGSLATSYITSCNITTSGTLRGSWTWQYGTTFTDLSGNGNTAYPTFRSASTSGLTATVTSQASTYTAPIPSGNVSGGWTMVTDVPTAPDDLNTEGGYGFPGGSLIRSAAITFGQNPETWLFAFAFGLSALLGLGVFALTHSAKMGERGSLVLASVVSEVVLVYFYRTQTVPAWCLIPLGIIALFLMVWRKSPNPID